jgi:hypothetical protein
LRTFAGCKWKSARAKRRNGVCRSLAQRFIVKPVLVATRGRQTKGKWRWPPSTALCQSRNSANDGSVVGRLKRASFYHLVGAGKHSATDQVRVGDRSQDREGHWDRHCSGPAGKVRYGVSLTVAECGSDIGLIPSGYLNNEPPSDYRHCRGAHRYGLNGLALPMARRLIIDRRSAPR